MGKLIVKVEYGKELRKISIPTAEFSILENSVSKLLCLAKDSFTIKYVDEENDLITLTSQPELDEAVKSVQSQAEGVLKIFVFRKMQNSINNNAAKTNTNDNTNVNNNNNTKPPLPPKETPVETTFDTPRVNSSTENGTFTNLLDTLNNTVETGYNQLLNYSKEASQTLQNSANNVVQPYQGDFIKKMLDFFDLQIKAFIQQANLISEQLTTQLKSMKGSKEASIQAQKFQKVIQEQFSQALENIRSLANNIMEQVNPTQVQMSEVEPENQQQEQEAIQQEQQQEEKQPMEEEFNSFVLLPREENEIEVEEQQEEPISTEMQQILDMGFSDKEKVRSLLVKHENQIVKVLEELL